MITDHARRASVMYPKKVTPEPARPAVTTGRAAAAAVLYGGSKSGQTGSIDWALHSSFDRIEASVRGDAEKEKQVQTTREKVRGLLTKANIAPADAHTLLSIYREARETGRSEEALKKQWEGPHGGFERLRLETGSTEAAMAKLARTDAVLEVLKKEDPHFAADLVRTGATQDPRFISTASKIVDSFKPKEQTT